LVKKEKRKKRGGEKNEWRGVKGTYLLPPPDIEGDKDSPERGET